MTQDTVQTEKTLGALIRDVWQARFFLLGGLALGLLAAAGFTTGAVPHYRAQMIVSPANPMNGAEVSSLLADDSLFALRYLVQRVGVANSSDFMRFENIYAGPSVAAFLLKDSSIRKGLAQDQSFTFMPGKDNWRTEELAEYLGRRVRFSPVGASPMRKLSYDHPDPEFGMYMLERIHRTADELIRLSIRQDADARITYLEKTISETPNPDHRRALTTLLLEQERLRMLARAETPYAAAVVEPAATGAKPEWPDAFLVFPAFMIAFAMAGFALYGFTASRRAQHRPLNWKQEWYSDKSENMNERPLTGAQKNRDRGAA